ncbi:MAG: VCBS repeat-containing protein, partial [Acidobacteriota bacterium]
GDGRLDLAQFVSGSWAFILSSTGYTQVASYGSLALMTDTFVIGDYDGDRKADMMTFRSTEGRWSFMSSVSGFAQSVPLDWGLPGDAAVPTDYDGDGRWDLAVFRPESGRWFVKRSSDGSMLTVDWGLATDVPVPADYDGDGRADVAIFRPSTGEWWIRYSSTDFTTYSTTMYGVSGDIPLPGDFDADGRAEPACWRQGAGGGLFVLGRGRLGGGGEPLLER